MSTNPDLPTGASIVNRRPEGASTAASDPSVLRKLLRDAQEALETQDRQLREERLRQAASMLGKRDPRELLDEMAASWGLSWNTMAKLLGVTASAMRKWRRPGGAMSPESREQVAILSAFLAMLQGVKEPIADIGSWMEMRLREDVTLKPCDIYASGPQGRMLLLDLGAEHVSVVEMLQAFDPDWRSRYARDGSFRVTDDGPGGERAIVPR